jgi:hypothetical protein
LVYYDDPQSIAFDKSGNLLLLWSQSQYIEDQDEYIDDLLLQLFDPHGTPLGPPVSVKSKASDIFTLAWGGHVVGAGNSWLVAWTAIAETTRDFSTAFIRRFARKK